MIYDHVSQLFFLYGGMGPGNVPLGDAFEFDPDTEEWIDNSVTPSSLETPKDRVGARLEWAADSGTDKIFLLGGRSTTTVWSNTPLPFR